ncbi:MAG: type I-F CRISPR-associated protein Csy3 [Oceanococcaceae bacterium]
MSDNKLTTASVLAFERKLDPSDGLMYSGRWEERNDSQQWPGVGLREKSVRGTISNRLKAKEQDPAKLDAAIENPNLQSVDVAALAVGHDSLNLRFSLRILPGTGAPSACNSAPYRDKLRATVDSYIDQHSFSELARRYALNLANGRFLWRNRLGAEAVEVRVSQLEAGSATQTWTFDALQLNLRELTAPEQLAPAAKELASAIEQGLSGQRHVLLHISAFARLGDGQEVYPSQELILDRARGDKSKTLYKVGDVAAMHSQKIGNALRTIDTWYPRAKEMGPIAVEPYGSVTTQGAAFRQPRDRVDFYSLLDNWVLKDKQPAEGDQHYVMAVLVRGGVFGKAE